MTRSVLIPPLAAAIIVAGLVPSDAAPAPARKDDPSNIGSTHAILMDAETGSVLFDKNPDRLIAPASLAKLMTVEVVFDQIALGNINLDQEFTVSENAWRKGGAPSRGSTMYAAIHSKIKVRDLLKGAIIQSANDGCIVLAEAIAGNEGEFARLMNERARELGLTRSTFTNSTGLHDPNMRVTVREIAKLSAHIIRTYPEYYRWFSEREFTWNKIRQTNRNPLLDMGIGADGLKTGHTQQAGYALAGSAVQNGLRLIVVIAGAKSEKERAEDARRLLEWGFRSFERRTLFSAGETVAEAKVFGGAKSTVSLVSKSDVTIFVPRGGGERLSAKVVYDGPIRAPISEDRPVGTLKVWRGDILAIEVPLETGESIPVGSTTQRAVDAVAELMYKLFRAGIGRL
ncbi:MAG TPA: D-alanyl-D-alanine carboxypeptidase family protein [Xanthobacteraceae bacterium]|nr:D-alanyl-D-alanine carboxypeptidase family protein [Xanthobacteraceae bacterium]